MGKLTKILSNHDLFWENIIHLFYVMQTPQTLQFFLLVIWPLQHPPPLPLHRAIWHCHPSLEGAQGVKWQFFFLGVSRGSHNIKKLSDVFSKQVIVWGFLVNTPITYWHVWPCRNKNLRNSKLTQSCLQFTPLFVEKKIPKLTC